MESWLVKISDIAQNIALNAGCELYDLEVVGSGKGRTLRIYIDKADTGVGIEECSIVAKAFNQILDADGAEELVPGGEYLLEVSSPGLDRHLKTKLHFEKVVGRKIFVQLEKNLGTFGATDKSLLNMKKFEEELKALEGDNLVFAFKAETVKVPVSAVQKSKVVFEMKKNLK